MDLKHKIRDDFGITSDYINVHEDGQVLCMVHSKWLNQLQTENRIPEKFIQHETLTGAECEFMMQNNESVSYPWKLINMHVLNKQKGSIPKLAKAAPRASSSSTDLSYSQLIHYVTETNYRNLWKQAWKKYQSLNYGPKYKLHEYQSYNEAVREIINRLYNCPLIKSKKDSGMKSSPNYCSTLHTSLVPEENVHPNLVQMLCAVETDTVFYLIYCKPEYSLQDCLMFSPAILDISTIRALFVVYQILQVLRSVHNQGLYMGIITLSDIAVKQNLWIQVMPYIWRDIWHEAKSECSHEEMNVYHQSCISTDKDSCNIKNQISSVEGTHQKKYIQTKNITNSLVMSWVIGSISNYDYLMELNKLAGRRVDNPKCHPVMPWIMDFTVPEGGWRDLSKSKYRLNKGDKQLDLTYESATSGFSNSTCGNYALLLQDSAIVVPHHISEVLSDITYYVYKARRMMKTTLCQHVRQKWVPAEYPSTIQRLQEWTPDECIPEFFSDATIFYSIHPDLSDLGVPWWCEDPEDFIKKHRATLESDHVSERLHHWIDITFGYRLSGNAAVKSKNVCLPLVDQHTAIKNYGMVQLFTQPHPHKLSASLYHGSLAPKTFRSVLQKIQDIRDSGDEETSSESSNKSGRWKVLRSKSMLACPDQPRAESRPENQTIVLPKDYNPLAALTQFESLFSFTAQDKDCKLFKGEKGEVKSNPETNSTHVHHRRSRDMLVLGCLIGEISFNSHLKAIPNNASLDERYSLLLNSLKNNKHEVPRCFQQVIQVLLQVTLPFSQDISLVRNIKPQMLPDQYPPVSSSGLPPPSAHQLLQPLVHTIPFPEYFSELYSFLEQLNKHSQLLESVTNSDTSWLTKQKLIAKLANSKVHFAAQRLLSLLPMLNAEGIELITPYIQEMFENPHTSLLASWHLFNIVAQSLGPQQTAQKLLVTLTKLFDTDIPSSKHMKLYHRSFLLQLIVRLGLNTFLAHFMTLLIEATGEFRDYSQGNSYNAYIDQETQNTVSVRKGSHLQSPELQQLLQENDFRKVLDGTTENTSSPYDEDSSNADPPGHLENMPEKESEMFYLEIAREYPQKDEKEKNTEESHCPNCMPSLLVQDDDKWRTDDEADDQLDEPEVEVSLSFCNKSDLNDVDNFSSCEKLEPPQTSIYSHSAPNLPSHLSCWPKSESSEDSSIVENAVGFNNFGNQSGVEKETGTSNKISQKIAQGFNISDVSSESVLWLAHRLGPVLTAKYLTRNLLRMLTLCYHGLEQQEMCALSDAIDSESSLSITGRHISGDKNSSKVLDCLSRVAALYGEHFITLQYLPHIADLLILCKRRLTETLEAGLLGAMALLHHIIPYLSDVTLMDHLQDVIIKDILYLVVRLGSSLRIAFPGGGKSRLIVICRLIDIIYLIGLRIGFEMTRKHLSSLIQRFFSCFDKVYDRNSGVKNSLDVPSTVTPGNSPLKERAFEEIRLAFTPEIAYLSYISFCKLAGGIHMEQTLKNDELIRKLCILHDMCVSHANPGEQSADDLAVSRNPTAVKSHHRVPSFGQDESFVSGVFGKNVIVVGNRLDIHLGEESHLLTTVADPVSSSHSSSGTKLTEGPKYDITLLRRKMNNSQRHLKGNWLAYWEHEIGRSEKDQHFNFKQIKLQSFVGHTGSVRTIHVLDNENSFLTSSKDKTVKLWSLRSCGDGSTQTPCQWTYTQHRKSVFAVSFLDSLRLVGSCDSTVHIWDPFMGSCIKQLESTKGSPVTFLTAMPAPSTTFLAATTSSTVRFLDARICRYMHEFKVSIGPAGLIRCLAVSPNGHWLAVGHSTGMISVLDVRTGLLYGTWMGHEGEILQLKAFNNSYFVTSSLDHSLSVWNAEDSQAKCNLRGPLEPVTCLSFYKGEVISGTTANRIGLHTTIDSKATYSSTRLRSDTFKGVLTSMSLLPLNRLLLLGADNGSVVLLS